MRLARAKALVFDRQATANPQLPLAVLARIHLTFHAFFESLQAGDPLWSRTYRASSVILVMFMFLLAGFCFHRAAVDLDVETSSWFVPAALFTMVALEFCLVHLSLRRVFMV
uniref:hypothetical protein n=1 Tax=uncultured Marinobacter sp. TaxID=187379 RepID=UPI002594F152